MAWGDRQWRFPWEQPLEEPVTWPRPGHLTIGEPKPQRRSQQFVDPRAPGFQGSVGARQHSQWRQLAREAERSQWCHPVHFGP
jgi:hypothetical protein